MRLSQFPVSTTKETPADAEIISHQLMLRAGLIRRLSSGLYSWMPIGLRVLQKVSAIVREEMNAAGCVELLMPSVHPAELWQESGRWNQMGSELLRMRDRHDRDFCYGPTHEEENQKKLVHGLTPVTATMPRLRSYVHPSISHRRASEDRAQEIRPLQQQIERSP